MKKRLSIIAGLGLTLSLSACNSVDGPYGDKGVDWYMAHNAERAEQQKWCNDQSAAAQLASAGCTQAGTAASRLMGGSASAVPHIVLTPDKGGKK